MTTITFELSDIDILLVQNPALHPGAFCHGLAMQYISNAKRDVVRQQIEVCGLHGVAIPPTTDDIVHYAYNGDFGFLSQKYQDFLQEQAAKAEAAAADHSALIEEITNKGE